MEKLTRALLAAAALSGALGACRAHDAPGLSRGAASPDGTTRIECAGEAGEEVRLAGSFDGWQAGLSLERDAEGRYWANLALPPGLSLVACVRRGPDGTVTSSAPLDAPAIDSDGFGGENGLYEGPQAALPVTSKQ
ncbi:MAG TPA: glycogen-binding domain-containing protein [Myxococcales bacterium]